MATKLYNSHLSKLMFECKQYYILDCYIALVHISSEIDGKFIIQTYSSHKTDLINSIKNIVNVSYKTIYNCIEKLIELDIISYNQTKEAWIINDMEYMVKKKNLLSNSDEELNKYTGYTYIRPIFITDDFNKMDIAEKRIIIYMSQLTDSNSGRFYKNFIMDLNNKKSAWFKILNTKSKYYAAQKITRMFSKYKNIIENVTEYKEYVPKKVRKFRFQFTSNVIMKKSDDNTAFNTVTLLHPNEYQLVKDSIKFFDVTLSKQKIMHLIRSIINIKNWLLKEQVVDIILKKYKAIQYYNSREDIKSLPKYAAAVVKAVIDEYKFAQSRLKAKKDDYTFNNITENLDVNINNNIALFS